MNGPDEAGDLEAFAAGGDSRTFLRKHCSEQPVPLEVLRPGLSPHLYTAIDRAMVKAPIDRFSSVGAFVQAMSNEQRGYPYGPDEERWLWGPGPSALGVRRLPQSGNLPRPEGWAGAV